MVVQVRLLFAAQHQICMKNQKFIIGIKKKDTTGIVYLDRRYFSIHLESYIHVTYLDELAKEFVFDDTMVQALMKKGGIYTNEYGITFLLINSYNKLGTYLSTYTPFKKRLKEIMNKIKYKYIASIYQFIYS